MIQEKSYIKEIINPLLQKSESLRILHVVGSMNRGGIETWLMHILRHIDREYFRMDFLVHTNEECAYDAEIRALGSKIIPCLSPSRPWIYASNFKKVLREYGPYDIVHSHVHYFNGYVLNLAKQAGVLNRISHTHLDSSAFEANRGWRRRLYVGLSKSLINRYATAGLGCSQSANVDLFGTNWKNDFRWDLLYYGINIDPFKEPIDHEAVRSEFNLPADAFVIGHVGRFDPQKNHQLLLQIFAEIVKIEPNAYLLLVGQGYLQTNIEQQANELSIADRVIFAGSRPDVSKLMRGAMDIFLFPSQYEGLGLVLIEAQAAGLPCIFSDVVPGEADLVKPLLKRLSLSQAPSEWAKEVNSRRNTDKQITLFDACKIVENSPFNIQTSYRQLQNFYINHVNRRLVI